MKTAVLGFFMTLFAGIAFSQESFNEPMREKASDSKVRFYSNSSQYEKASDFKVRFFSNGYFRENQVRGEFLMNNPARGEKYFNSYNLGVINQSLLLNNFRLRTNRTGKGKC